MKEFLLVIQRQNNHVSWADVLSTGNNVSVNVKYKRLFGSEKLPIEQSVDDLQQRFQKFRWHLCPLMGTMW